MLHQHVVKVDNIVKSTGTLPVMQTLIKNTVKTQMAGSFDVVRAELAEVIKNADVKAQSLPLWTAPKPKQVVEPTPAPVSAETTEGEQTVPGGSEDLFSTSLAPVPGAGPINLDAPKETTPEPDLTPVEVKEEPRETGMDESRY